MAFLAMPRFTLTAAVPQIPAGISCRYFLSDPAQTDRQKILVAAFAGEFPDGSRGNPHGRYIASCTLHGLRAFSADCVILDLRDLTYRWGDALLAVFDDIAQFKDAGGDPGCPPFPVAVVTSEKCRDAVLSLVTPRGREPPEWHFEDMDSAIEYGVRKANEWLDF
jgi:hypothetical protein